MCYSAAEIKTGKVAGIEPSNLLVDKTQMLQEVNYRIYLCWEALKLFAFCLSL